ncbi:iron complex transport system permease protein [Paenibacillus shirakamiensis]|uniref:Iron complex transport system permease protein n=1 Tax=Paenibacillus shirakamiensis TaxID=1265935 RepID=A0ABS4JMC9_9BACL|nr:iron ABC transporter permease [Paenibacillus shirakamiensis]MBP2002270.1 iron complex transport system permease protein [Paenibacillus shirakamiensis]
MKSPTMRPSNRVTQVITFVVLVAVVIVSIGLGSVKIPIGDLLSTLFGHSTGQYDTIMWDIRIPRVMLALFIGANLAISGAMLQAVMNNPLADPGLTGVSSGAAVAALFVLLVMPEFGSMLPVVAVGGGVIASAMVYLLSWNKRGITPIRVILSGVAVNAIFGGFIGLMSILYSEKLPGALQWLNGSLSGKGMGDAMTIVPYSLVGWIAAFFCIRKANTLRLGEQVAVNLGESMTKVRILLSLVAVYLAAVSVSVVGLIGFVGLVVPHMARIFVGSNYSRLIPMSLMLGGIVLVVADTVGRTLFAPLDIPAGIVMAIVGGPYFLYLMRKGEV